MVERVAEVSWAPVKRKIASELSGQKIPAPSAVVGTHLQGRWAKRYVFDEGVIDEKHKSFDRYARP